jgi:hypothetical protein
MIMTPVATTFAIVLGIVIIAIILVLIFDRPKTPKGNPDKGQENANEAGHRL